jgi:putative phage-type endonuclease
LSFYINEGLEQGTTEWLDWRRGVVGASEAPTIMGENPWASPKSLMDKKLGLSKEFSGNNATREGQRLEGPARKDLEHSEGIKLRPVVVQDKELPFLAASLDALDKTNTLIYEIKCGVKSYEKTISSKQVPSYYFAQLQHMLMVTRLDCMYFAAYRPDRPLLILEVDRDDKYIKKLRSTEEKFVTELIKRGHSWQRTFVGIEAR